MEFHSPAQHLAAEVATFALQLFDVVCPGASLNVLAWAAYSPVLVYGKSCQAYPLKVIVISFFSTHYLLMWEYALPVAAAHRLAVSNNRFL